MLQHLSRLLMYLSPKGEFPRTPCVGSIGLSALFTLCTIKKIFIPPYDLSEFRNRPVYWFGGWVVGWAYLTFGTLEHVRTIFLTFLLLEGVWHRRGTILKSV